MRLTVVGSAPAYAFRPGEAASSYLVEADGEALALDLGQGAFGALSAYRDPASLEAVFVTHLHPDHHVDLVALRHYLRYGEDRPRSVHLHGPEDLRSRIDALNGETDFLECMPGEPVGAGTTSCGGFRVEARPVTHALQSHAFRVTRATGNGADGPGLVYSGDCGVPDDLLPLVRPGDTLLCEATWGTATDPPSPDLHLTALEAARVAREAGAARLYLTHVLDRYEPERAAEHARPTFGGPIELAVPGMQVDIG